MALGLNRIWVRFGLWITAAVLVTIATLALGMLGFAEYQYREFNQRLPTSVRAELDVLQAQNLEDSPRALQIYSEYWEGDSLFGERWSLAIGLAISLPLGMAAGFWISRRITNASCLFDGGGNARTARQPQLARSQSWRPWRDGGNDRCLQRHGRLSGVTGVRATGHCRVHLA